MTLTCILLAAAARLLPHPPNVTPLTAMALLGGAYLSRGQALLLPLAALFASDLVLGLHATVPFVYGSFVLVALLGTLLRADRRPGRLAVAALASSALFFVVTNLGTWLVAGLYTRDLQGLAACYAAALPFLRNSLLGDLAYTALLFGLENAGLRTFARAQATA